MSLITFLIALLSITHSLFPMHMNKIPDDVVVQIISKPDMAALGKIVTQQIYNQHKPDDDHIDIWQKNYKIPYLQTRNALIQCFNLLLTCTQYYNNSFKNKVIDALAARKFPQGIMLFLLPKWIQFKTFTKIPDETHVGQSMPLSLFQKEKAVKKLANLCLRSNITHDELFAATKSLTGSFNDIIYLRISYLQLDEPEPDSDDIQSYTLIEYLEKTLVLKLATGHQFFGQGLPEPVLKNLFTLIDCLRLSGKTDLTLPVVLQPNKSIEGYICDIQQRSEENAPSNRISLLSPGAPAKSIYARPPEHQHIIKALANLFLFPLSKDITLIKKELQKEKKEFRNELVKKGTCIIIAVLILIINSILKNS